MKVAVTGASGHIGVNLIPKLINAGYDLRILSHKNIEVLNKFRVPIIKGDLLDQESLRLFIYDADIVIHLAAVITIQKRSQGALKVNIQGTKNLLKVAKESSVRKFIHFSSIHSLMADPSDQQLDETRSLNMNSPFDYDKSKAISENMVLGSNNEKFETVILNPTSVVGPFDYKPSLMGRAIIQLYNGKIPALLDGGYDWVDVRDVVNSTLASIPQSLSGEKFILSGKWQSIAELGEAVAENGGRPCPKMKVPFWMAYLGAYIQSIIPVIRKEKQLFTAASLDTLKNGHKNISSGKAAKMLGHQPRPIRKTVADTVQWFKENNMMG